LPAACDLDFIPRFAGPRFVSQKELDDSNARCDEQWRQVHAWCADPISPAKCAMYAYLNSVRSPCFNPRRPRLMDAALQRLVLSLLCFTSPPLAHAGCTETSREPGEHHRPCCSVYSTDVFPKAAKQDAWEERNRLANQFRALEADEVQFLDSVRERQLDDEDARRKADADGLSHFKTLAPSLLVCITRH
jgi:hypothetical protein